MREQIMEDMKIAMKNQEKETLAVIRMVKGAIQLEELNLKRTLTDDEVITVITKQIKMRKESLIEFEKANREDLIEQTNQEIEILNRYMPIPFTEEEIDKKIEQAMDTIHPTSMKDMGRLMSILTPELKGKADMSIVSQKIKKILEQK